MTQQAEWTDWIAWHRRYEDEPAMAGRLREVQRLTRAALDAARPGPLRLISICAGDGRDVIGALRRHPRRGDVHARLVELDSRLVEAGRRAAQVAALPDVEFVQGDAGDSGAYAGAVPADVVLVCGVFGNINDSDVEATVRYLPRLCAEAATVVWTRGRFAPDLTPTIRSWFSDSGFDELEFVTIADSTAAVGAARLSGTPPAFVPGVRLFTFLPDDLRPSRRADRNPGT